MPDHEIIDVSRNVNEPRDGEAVIQGSGTGSGSFGAVYINSEWSYNVNGMYQIAPDRPWGFNVAGSLTGREGYPIPYWRRIARGAINGPSSVYRNLQVVESDEFRNEDVHTVDARIEKEFQFSDFGCHHRRRRVQPAQRGDGHAAPAAPAVRPQRHGDQRARLRHRGVEPAHLPSRRPPQLPLDTRHNAFRVGSRKAAGVPSRRPLFFQPAGRVTVMAAAAPAGDTPNATRLGSDTSAPACVAGRSRGRRRGPDRRHDRHLQPHQVLRRADPVRGRLPAAQPGLALRPGGRQRLGQVDLPAHPRRRRDRRRDGTVSIPKRARVGVLRQDHFRYEDDAHPPRRDDGPPATLWEAIAEKERLLALPREQFDGERYAELEDVILAPRRLHARGARGRDPRGPRHPQPRSTTQPLSTLSGGFKLRVLLAQVLAVARPTCCCSTSPPTTSTSSPSAGSRSSSPSYAGCALVISHDHRFLDNVSTHILDVDYETILLYPATTRDFVAAKVAERERKEAEIAKQEKQIADHQAVRRPLQGQGHQGAPGAVEAQADRAHRDRAAAAHLAALPDLQASPQRAAVGQGRARGRGHRQGATATSRCSTDVALDGAARRPARHHRPQRHRQVDAAQDR